MVKCELHTMAMSSIYTGTELPIQAISPSTIWWIQLDEQPTQGELTVVEYHHNTTHSMHKKVLCSRWHEHSIR